MAQTEPCIEPRKAVDEAFFSLVSLILENKSQGKDPKSDTRLVKANTDLNEALNRFAGCRCVYVASELSR